MKRLVLVVGAMAVVGACKPVQAPTAQTPVAQAPAPQAPANDLRGLAPKVQEFFDWYLLNTDETRTIADVLRDRPQVLDSALRDLLAAELECTTRSRESCRLDFDPFVNAQDLCVMYKLRDARQVADTLVVPVYAGCLDFVEDTSRRLTALVQRRDSGWVFVDIVYPRGERLTTLLRGSKP